MFYFIFGSILFLLICCCRILLYMIAVFVVVFAVVAAIAQYFCGCCCCCCCTVTLINHLNYDILIYFSHRWVWLLLDLVLVPWRAMRKINDHRRYYACKRRELSKMLIDELQVFLRLPKKKNQETDPFHGFQKKVV